MTVSRTADGKLISDAESVFTTPKTGSSYQVLAVSSVTSSYNFAAPGSAADTKITVLTDYDSFGNVLRVETGGNALLAGSVSVQDYSVDESIWQLGTLTDHAEYSDATLQVLLLEERYTYDAATRLIVGHDRWNNIAAEWLQTSYGYDIFGNVISESSSTGSTKTTTFGADFNSFVTMQQVSTSPQTSLSRSFETEASFGTVTKTTDVCGAVRNRTIDWLGRLISESRTSPDGSVVETFRASWSMQGNLFCGSTSERLDWKTDAWTTSRAFSDGLGRTVRTERDPANGAQSISVSITYNSRGARLTQTLPHFAGDVAAEGTWVYDALGRVTQAKTPSADGTSMTSIMSYPATNIVSTTVAVGTPFAQTTAIQYGSAAFRFSFGGREYDRAAGAYYESLGPERRFLVALWFVGTLYLVLVIPTNSNMPNRLTGQKLSIGIRGNLEHEIRIHKALVRGISQAYVDWVIPGVV